MALNHFSWFEVCKPALHVLKTIKGAGFKPWSRAVTRTRATKRGSFLSVVCWLEHYGFVKYDDGKWRATKKKYVMPELFDGSATDTGNRTTLLHQLLARYKTTTTEVLGDVKFGGAVLARDEFFYTLNNFGLSAARIAQLYGQKQARVTGCIERQKNRLLQQKTYGEA